MSMSKKKITPYAKRKAKEEPNKKLIIWVASVLGLIIVGMSVLLIVNS
ncbi:hypothetical protein P9314_13510 [Paenibacillus validus]|nr:MULTISPECIES: hypothetical protein [Paenibacillus]MED4601718.1 hypothetical protein [Paenibacillus validus]MED4608742.1 hypothetical protein [Paenibacillus validus]